MLNNLICLLLKELGCLLDLAFTKYDDFFC